MEKIISHFNYIMSLFILFILMILIFEIIYLKVKIRKKRVENITDELKGFLKENIRRNDTRYILKINNADYSVILREFEY
ncbi:hypothetical protein H3N56_11305 [Cetobacterium sp. 2A]|uniref:hypothetical protein n=1 Tax=Cetobacterium sp. 2A TaxID=2754723 RepID=UPI00163BC710|nr:hypothetical protein [Cetobacterium sp. 2A]MBC2857019.1 hypothetical protein [Cetobacterium sp. 2A]